MSRRTHKFFKVFKIFFVTFYKGDLTLLATSMAFSTIFALVPMLALFMAVSKLAGNFWDFSQDFKQGVLSYVTAGSGADLVDKFNAVLGGVDPAGMGTFGLLGLFLASIKIVYDFDSTILRIWKEGRSSQWWKRILIYSGIVLISPLALSATAGMLDWDFLSQFVSLFLTTTSILILVSLFICFKFTPPVYISYPAALTGTAFTYLFLSLGKEGYTWATSHIFSYDRLYGSLAFLPLFLFWLFFIWCFILAGFTMTKAVDDVLAGKSLRESLRG